MNNKSNNMKKYNCYKNNNKNKEMKAVAEDKEGKEKILEKYIQNEN